jgi:uncharacterized damage-inducible protein DinB
MFCVARKFRGGDYAAEWRFVNNHARAHFYGCADGLVRVDTGQVYNPPRFRVRRICGFEENPMNVTLTGLLVVSFLAGTAAAASGPAESDFKALFAKHWQISKEFTLAVAEAMPAEGYDFKPNPEELSFGQLMIHIAAQNSDSCASATGTKPIDGLSSTAWPAATDRQTAIKFLTLSFDKCAKDLDAMPPEQWNKEVYKVRGQPVLASEALWYTFTHTAHHRGQAEVYLRVKNIKPPAWRF